MKQFASKHKPSFLFVSFTCFALAFVLFYFSFLQINMIQDANWNNENPRKNVVAIQKSDNGLAKNDHIKEEKVLLDRTYKASLAVYEDIQNVKASRMDVSELEEQYASVLKLLSEQKYKEADRELLSITEQLSQMSDALTVSPTNSTQTAVTPSPAQINNDPPGNGFSVQTVQSEVGTFIVNVISADLNSTKVVVDTASDSDCADNCPVLSLSDFVSRSGAYAGINGSYFCPASYPACAGKTNSFDTLIMNKNKTYLNSENNIYSTVPLVVFSPGSVRFVNASSGWGRDTSVEGVIANQPLLVSDGNVVFSGDGDPKKGSKGPRSFVSSKDNRVYIGVVNGATVAEAAHVLKAMGMENALNLDSGGSTALWYEGYKVGPGRSIPNAILFIRK